MNVTIENKEKNQVTLKVEVEPERFQDALDQAFKKVVKKVSVPGFRKGKVPRKIFEQRFGVESLYQDALDILLPDAYSEAVEQSGIEPVDRPEINLDNINHEEPLVFTAVVTVKPELQLGQYKELELEAKDFSVKDEDIEHELHHMQEQHATLIVIEDGEIEKGDMVRFDFAGYKGEEAFEGGTATDYTMEIGSGQFIPGFEDQMLGMKVNEERDINVTFPEDYHAEDLAGQPVVFKVKVHEIKRKQLPALDDEFAKDVSEFDTLEELKADLRKELEERATEDELNFKRDTLLEKAAENATVEIPDVMIEHEIDHMLEDFNRQLQMQGISLDQYYKFTGTDEEQIREQFKADAEKRVRISLTLEAIVKTENIEVTDEEVDVELQKLADLYQRTVEEIKSIFTMQGGGLSSISEDLKRRKAIDLLVETAKTVA